MRKLIFILIALISFSQAQTIQYIGAPTTTVISRGNFRTDSIFYLPKRTKIPTDTAAFRYQISDSSLYYWTGYQWTKVQSASSFALVDTTVISTRTYRQKGIDSVQYNVGLKVNITDTSNMLSPYFRKVDTSTLSNRINLKLNISDTSTMLSPYARTSDVNASLALKLNISDTSTMLSPYFRKVDTLTLSNRINLKLNISDTSTMLSPYARTSNVNASLATKVNISDTSTMLQPYLRKSDTLTLSNRINLKVNISDTASMLTPYLRKVDTTAMLSPYYRSATATAALATKLNISDTSTMLSPYIRHAGYGLTKTSQALSVDTALMATRLRVGKVVDSLGGVIATKGSGTVTSVATGYGLSGGTITTTGTLIADTALVASRLRLGKVADSLSLVKQNVLTNPVTGTGTTNYVPKFTGTSTIGNSLIFDNGSNIGINTTSPVHLLNLSQTSGGTVIQLSNTFNTPANRNWSLQSNYLAYGDFSINTSNALFGDAYNAGTARMYINPSGELLINTTTDAGAYTLQNNGALYNTGSAILAATSGSVGIGTTSPSFKLDVNGGVRHTGTLRIDRDSGQIMIQGVVPSFGQVFTQTIDNLGDTRISTNRNLIFRTSDVSERMRLTQAGRLLIRTDAESIYELDVNGSIRSYFSAYFNTSSGESYFGTTTDAGNYRVQVSGNSYISGALDIGTTTNRAKMTLIANNEDAAYISNSGSNTIVQMSNNNTTGDLIYRLRQNAGAGNFFDIRYYGSSNYLGFDYGGNNAISISSDRLVGVGTTTPSASAQLDVTSTTRGFLPPRMTTTQRDLISSPAAGLVIYNTTTSKLQVYTTSWTDLH